MSAGTLFATIIDSNESARELMRAKVEQAGIPVEAERPLGIAAQEAIQQLNPPLMFIAIEQPIQRAMQTIEFARAQAPDSLIVAYASTWSPLVERRLMQAGVNDFLHGKITRERVRGIARRVRSIAREAAEAARPIEATGRIVAVIGQKGGIGKTTTSTNIATAIAREGTSSVLVIDLDTRFGDVAVMMDVTKGRSVAEVAAEFASLDRESFRESLVLHDSGVYILPAATDYRNWLNCPPEQLQEMIRFAATMFDVVILDTPGTHNDIVGSAMDIATCLVVVTSTDLASLKNTSLLLEHLEASGRAHRECLITLIHGHTIEGGFTRDDVEYSIGRHVDHEVPFDRNVQRASQAGIPVVQYMPHSPAANAFSRLAGHVAGFDYEPAVPQEPIRGRFFRLFGSRKSRSAPAAADTHLAV